MLHKFLTLILPLCTPVAFYSLYAWLNRRSKPNKNKAFPWFWLFLIGVSSMIIALLVLGMIDET